MAEMSATEWLRQSKGGRREKITASRILALAEASIEDGEHCGLCCACGAEAEGCEPDASNYRCESCGKPAVFGAQSLLIEVRVV